MLKALDLYKFYVEGTKNVRALSGASLEAKEGQVLAIVGPSGAGKSTLLHLLGGLDKPTKGTVLLDGDDIYELNDADRCRIRNEKIGFVFQFYHLLPELTALENVMLPAMINKDKKRDSIKRATRLLETVGLKERVNHKPCELSGGEAQRVAIARALVNDPKIVLCDEPTGNLDSEMSANLRNLIWRLSKESNKTFIIVTHEPSMAERADRILRIKDGQIQGDEIMGAVRPYKEILKGGAAR
jgi:lipoprotein-releasing system ATP-binding protein